MIVVGEALKLSIVGDAGGESTRTVSCLRVLTPLVPVAVKL